MKYIGFTSPCWTIQERKFPPNLQDYLKKENAGCGPGAHDVSNYKIKFSKSPEWRFNLNKHTKSQSLPPPKPPEGVQKKPHRVAKKSKSHSNFAQAPRFKNNKRTELCPDFYEITSLFHSRKQFSCYFASKEYQLTQDKPKCELGPGKYHP